MAQRVPVYIVLTEEGVRRCEGVPLSHLIERLTVAHVGPWSIIYPTSGKAAASHVGAE